MVTLSIVLLVGTYLVSLAAVALLAPTHASRFLLGFAGSARVHYLELVLRAVAGAAFVLHARRCASPSSLEFSAGCFSITTAGLVVVPWRWHRAFAERTVPYATRYVALIGFASLVFGAFIWASALAGRGGS